jgi:hypothetical protein
MTLPQAKLRHGRKSMFSKSSSSWREASQSAMVHLLLEAPPESGHDVVCRTGHLEI